MDLFNPPPIFNYTKMTEDVTMTTLDNPYVQVVWEDYAENFLGFHTPVAESVSPKDDGVRA